jgi:hypothetical protein
MSGAVRAATSVGTRANADTGRESDFPVLTVVSSTLAPRGGRLDVVPVVRQILSGSSGTVDAGVC